MPRIRFTNLFAERMGGVNTVDVLAASVDSALRALTDRHPTLIVVAGSSCTPWPDYVPRDEMSCPWRRTQFVPVLRSVPPPTTACMTMFSKSRKNS
jgi:hypothetical protein